MNIAAQCTGKPVYLTFSAAQKVARRQRRQTRSGVEAYHCRACSHFHVGSTQFTKARGENPNIMAELRRQMRRTKTRPWPEVAPP